MLAALSSHWGIKKEAGIFRKIASFPRIYFFFFFNQLFPSYLCQSKIIAWKYVDTFFDELARP